MIEILYPPNIRAEVDLRQFGRWPSCDFSWLVGMMRESEARVVVSPEVVQYHVRVLGEKSPASFFTRNIDIPGAILYFLLNWLKLGSEASLLELCSGTGVMTTPLASHFSVVAVEESKEYVTWYQAYLDNVVRNGTQQLRDRVRLCQGDIGNDNIGERIRRINDQSFGAVVLNPPFDLIPESLELAKSFTSTAIIAVLPLDVIVETEEGFSWRKSMDRNEGVWKDVRYVQEFRKTWKLKEVVPFLRPDGTAQTGCFLFTPKS